MVLSWIRIRAIFSFVLKSIDCWIVHDFGIFYLLVDSGGNLFSRKHEFEADNFAKNAVGGAEPLISALRKLYVENLSHPLPHPLMSGFHYSHPTLLEREGAMRKKIRLFQLLIVEPTTNNGMCG